MHTKTFIVSQKDQEGHLFAVESISDLDIVRMEYVVSKNILILILSTQTYNYKAEQKIQPFQKTDGRNQPTGGVQWGDYMKAQGQKVHDITEVSDVEEIKEIWEHFNPEYPYEKLFQKHEILIKHIEEQLAKKKAQEEELDRQQADEQAKKDLGLVAADGFTPAGEAVKAPILTVHQ